MLMTLTDDRRWSYFYDVINSNLAVKSEHSEKQDVFLPLVVFNFSNLP